MRPSRVVAIALFVTLLLAVSRTASSAQASLRTEPQPTVGLSPAEVSPQQQNETTGPSAPQDRDLAKERRKQQWREIKRDSERLLEVATELKQYVDKSGEGVLSVEVIRKAEEMEKLSKALQKKMKSAY